MLIPIWAGEAVVAKSSVVLSAESVSIFDMNIFSPQWFGPHVSCKKQVASGIFRIILKFVDIRSNWAGNNRPSISAIFPGLACAPLGEFRPSGPTPLPGLMSFFRK